MSEVATDLAAIVELHQRVRGIVAASAAAETRAKLYCKVYSFFHPVRPWPVGPEPGSGSDE
ncbi:hypothetical protein [Nocardia sp. BMG111209]|uniref:hypothetical protein n=1 Tax=Nocardia sp. BMG111209 TaxID=1160137 RepID=UPI00037A43D4|nr:hypothetical protein [Nocardia sp. BMG111209]